MDERDSLILRRTLSAISALYASFGGLIGGLGWHVSLYPKLMVLHSLGLALAAFLLWKPRPGSLAVTLLAAAGSIAFAWADVRLHHPQTALLDGAYAFIAGVLLVYSRRPA